MKVSFQSNGKRVHSMMERPQEDHGNQPRELVLYSDVDGTLVGKSGEVSTTVIKQIEGFIAAGHGFTLATGRSYKGVRRLLEQIPINTPLVLCNGAYVYDPVTGQARWSSLSPLVVKEVLPLLNHRSDIRVYLEDSDNTLWVSDPAILREPFILKEDLQPRVFKHLEDVLEGAEVLKMGFHLGAVPTTEANPLQNLISYLSSNLATEVSWCFSSTDYLEIMSFGTSKWSGILNSQALRGCQDKTIVTVGDQHNDLEMIHHADLGVAMGNAVTAVKEKAARCIGDVEDGAIAHLMHELCLPLEENKAVVY